MEHLSEALLPVLERLDRIESSMDKNQTPKLMTIKDLVQYSRLSEATIRRHIMRGSLEQTNYIIRCNNTESSKTRKTEEM